MITNVTMLVHNRPNLTRQALNTLEDTRNIRLCVLGHKCDEEMQQVIGYHGPEEKTICYTWEDLGTGDLRNKVIQTAEAVDHRGAFLYLSDNDVAFLDSNWLSKLIDKLVWAENFHGFKAIGAYNHPFNQPVERFDGCYSVNHLATQSMLMRWSTWDEFGPFCSTPAGKVCQSEDVEFSNRIREAGYKVGVISPALIANTGITNSCGEKIPGWEMVKAQCPKGVICE